MRVVDVQALTWYGPTAREGLMRDWSRNSFGCSQTRLHEFKVRRFAAFHAACPW